MNFKSILACAALLIGIGTATAAVESDVVGYQNIDIKPGFNMIAFNFQPLEGEGVSIQDFVANKEDLVAGYTIGTSDKIQVWDPATATFTVYFYRAYKATNPNKFLSGPAWVKTTAATTPTTDTILAGSGVWFARPDTAAEGEITVSGKITTESNTHEIQPGFNMISSAFPTDMALNDGAIDWEACGAVAGYTIGTSDKIQVWDSETKTFTTYFYRAYKATNPNKFLLGPAWVKSSAATVPTTDTIPAGMGFWYARPAGKAEGTLTETSPIAE